MHRMALLAALSSVSAFTQFKTAVPLVFAPALVRDSHGNVIDGLTESDLILYDNNVRQPIHLEWSEYPIDLVVAIQRGANAGAVLDKLGRAGILLTQLIAANGGATAVISFSSDVRVEQNFTGDPDAVTHAIQHLHYDEGGGRTLDALVRSALSLEKRPVGRRRIILIVSERRDRGSETKLPAAVEAIQRSNAAVYWLTFSPFLQPFTAKLKTKEDLKPESERIKYRKCALCPGPDDTPIQPDVGPGGGKYALGELARLRLPDVSEMITKVMGGKSFNVLKKNALERAIEEIGQEVHRQYIVTFQPAASDAGSFHSLRIEVKDRPDLKVVTRTGYWSLHSGS